MDGLQDAWLAAWQFAALAHRGQMPVVQHVSQHVRLNVACA
jgi:hypothetical protein